MAYLDRSDKVEMKEVGLLCLTSSLQTIDKIPEFLKQRHKGLVKEIASKTGSSHMSQARPGNLFFRKPDDSAL